MEAFLLLLFVCKVFFSVHVPSLKYCSQFNNQTYVNTQMCHKTFCLCVSVLQGVRLEGSRVARGDPDAAASVPISPVQCGRLPPASLLWRQQDQNWGIDTSDMCRVGGRAWILWPQRNWTFPWCSFKILKHHTVSEQVDMFDGLHGDRGSYIISHHRSFLLVIW